MINKSYKFSEVVELVGGGTPKTTVAEYWNGNIPWLSVVDFNTGSKYVYNTEKSITTAGLNNSSTKILKAGDIIISARGTVGAIAMLGKDMAFNQSCYGIKAIDNISDNHYLYYALKNAVQDFIQVANGGVFDTITRSTFEHIDIMLPSLSQQKAIASVLSSLDDKIDLLHRQNQTLEAMAETLFKEWFVINAKEEWKEKPLDEIANFLNGLACQKFPPKDEVNKLPVLKIKDLQNGISGNSDWASSDLPEVYLVKNGDVIFSWSASLIVKIWDGEECVLNQHLFKVTSKNYPKWFYYQWTKQYLDEFIAVAKSHATTMGHIKRSDLKQAMVKVPTEKEIIEMNKHFAPILDKIISNNKQIKTLTKLRDALLPKLMSGEIRINH